MREKRGVSREEGRGRRDKRGRARRK